MNYKRAVGIAILLYLSSFFLYGLSFFIPFLSEPNSLNSYIFFWLLNIPLVLLFAKWFFKKISPTTKRGFQFGLIIIAVAFALDGLAILGTYAAGESLEEFAALYTDWKFYVSVLEIIALATFAGWEFDGTHSKKA